MSSTDLNFLEYGTLIGMYSMTRFFAIHSDLQGSSHWKYTQWHTQSAIIVVEKSIDLKPVDISLACNSFAVLCCRKILQRPCSYRSSTTFKMRNFDWYRQSLEFNANECHFSVIVSDLSTYIIHVKPIDRHLIWAQLKQTTSEKFKEMKN